MDEARRLELPFAASLVCELVRVVRNHHDSMVGDDRERPGWDRVLLRLESGEVVVADLWTRTGQSIAEAPRWIALRDDGEIVRWTEADAAALRASSFAANDDANRPVTTERRRRVRVG